MTYTITLKGQPCAIIASSTPKGKSVITMGNCYDVTIEDDKDLDIVFLTTFAAARTDQAFLD